MLGPVNFFIFNLSDSFFYHSRIVCCLAEFLVGATLRVTGLSVMKDSDYFKDRKGQSNSFCLRFQNFSMDLFIN